MDIKNIVKEIVNKCNKPTGDLVLDSLFIKYNESSPRDDSPVYYRFLYELAKVTKNNPLTMIELGCKYGAASLHFLKGGGKKSIGVDPSNLIDLNLFSGYDFQYKQCFSTDIEFFNSTEDVDIVFVDTDHSYNLTVNEYNLWKSKIKPGGLMLFDDILATEYGCAKFWRELLDDKLDFEELHPIGWGFGIVFK